MDEKTTYCQLSNEDLRAALKEMKTYMDITEDDLKRIYAITLRHAEQRLASGFAVAFAMIAMMATKTLHPPGGATALIAVIGGPKIHALGFLYAFIPAGLGAFILVVVALLINNLSRNRRYPEYWF
jgi:CBS-domain-containing membrane protein